MSEAIAAELIARFDAAVPDMWEPHAAPTSESLARIEADLGCRLPPLLVDFASRSRSFSSFFLSLGPDYDEHRHILARNAFVRADPWWLRECKGVPAPAHLVLISENFMHDFFWCIDARAGPCSPIAYWSPSECHEREHPDFEDFMRIQVDHYEAKRRR